MPTNFRFAPFELRTDERVLLVDGVECQIGSRAFDVLLALIERRERVVTKRELFDLAWKDLVVEENNLSVQISTLRKVLGAHAIATITGRGYRFTAACESSTTPSPSPTQAQAERRMVVIACAEIANWRALLSENPTSTVMAWQSTRTNIIESQVALFGGQPVEIAGERLLIRFDTVVNAVVWALDLQERMEQARRNGASPPLHLRVGVVVEDVILDSTKLARNVVHFMENLEQNTGPDDVIVTDAVHAFLQNRLPVTFYSLGEQQLPNCGRSVRIYRVVPKARQPAPKVVSPNLMRGELPTIAVLPFSVDPESDKYLGDGITEEIITGLSMNRSLIVIARDSARRYRGTGASAIAAAELGVRYIVSGSVERVPPGFKIDVELIDTGVKPYPVLWRPPRPFTFKGADADLFALLSQIAAKITAEIDPSIREAEIQRARRSPAVGAYDYVLRGISMQFEEIDDFKRAGDYFRRAIEIDPNYAQAHAHLARWHSLHVGEGRSESTANDRRMAGLMAERAAKLDGRDAWVLATAGHIKSFLFKQFDEALDMFERALHLNPISVTALFRSGTTLAYLGRGEEALERVHNAMQLSPFDYQTFSFCTTKGIASIVNARYDEAVKSLRRAVSLNPNYRASARLLIAARSLAGETTEARELAKEFLQAEPTFRVSQFGAWYPLQPPHLERVLDGLRMAGLPD